MLQAYPIPPLPALAPARPRIRPWIAVLLAVLAVAAIALPLLLINQAPRHVPAEVAAKLTAPKRVVPKAELPPVEPVDIADLAPEDARKINAAIPFSRLPNPAARAFHIFGAEEDRLRAIDCLAAAVLYEAGDDAVGERAVAQVVINRVRHPAFPKSVCGVVFQGSERATGCQFTFTCDGALARLPSPAAWKRAQDVARMALQGSVYKPVGHATHYHTDWVVPYWSSSLEKITEVHTHLFFRWTGWWGTPPAFNRSYTGVEPRIPQLAALSAVHGGGAGEVPMETLATTIIDPATLGSITPPAPSQYDENTFLVVLDKKMGPDAFAALAIRTCGERAYCKFMGWTDPKAKPATPIFTAAQLDAMSFSYLRDQSNGFAKALWNCNEFRRPSPVQCMMRQALGPRAAMVSAPASPPPPGIKLDPAKARILAAPPVPALSGVRRKGEIVQPIAEAPAQQTQPAPALSAPRQTTTFSVPAAASEK